jgi:hypothetical protein
VLGQVVIGDSTEEDLRFERVSDVEDEGILKDLERGLVASSDLSDCLAHLSDYI